MALFIVPSSSNGAVRPVRRRNVSLPMLFCFLVVAVATSTVLLPTEAAVKKTREGVVLDALDTARDFLEYPYFHEESRAVAMRQLWDVMGDSPFFGKSPHKHVIIISRKIEECLENARSSLSPKTIISLVEPTTRHYRVHYINNRLVVKPSSSDIHDALVETMEAQKTIWESDYCKTKLQDGYFKNSSAEKMNRRIDFILSLMVHRAFTEWLQSNGLGNYPKALSIFFVATMRNFEQRSPLKWDSFQSRISMSPEGVKTYFEEVFFSDVRRTVAVNQLNRLLRLEWGDLTEDTQKIFKEAKERDASEDHMTVSESWAKQQEGQVKALKQQLRKTTELLVGYKDQAAIWDLFSETAFVFVTETRRAEADRVTLAATCAATKEGVVNSLTGRPLKQPVVYIAKFNKLPFENCSSCKAYRLEEALYPPRLRDVLKQSTEEAAQLVKEVLPNYCFSGEDVDALELRRTDFYKMGTQNVVAAALGKRPTIKEPTTLFSSFRTPVLPRPWNYVLGPSVGLLFHFLRLSGFVSRKRTRMMNAELNTGLFMVSFLLGDTIQEFLRGLQQNPFYSKEIKQNWSEVFNPTE